MKVQITLKSGVQIEFHVKTITKMTNPLTETQRLEWTSADPMAPHLFDINLAEVAAIVTTREHDEATEDL